MGVDQLDDRHRPDQENQRGADLAHAIQDLVIHHEMHALLHIGQVNQRGRMAHESLEILTRGIRNQRGGREHIHHPQNGAKQQGGSRLIHLQRMLHGDHQIANQEHQDHNCHHKRIFFNVYS